MCRSKSIWLFDQFQTHVQTHHYCDLLFKRLNVEPMQKKNLSKNATPQSASTVKRNGKVSSGNNRIVTKRKMPFSMGDGGGWQTRCCCLRIALRPACISFIKYNYDNLHRESNYGHRTFIFAVRYTALTSKLPLTTNRATSFWARAAHLLPHCHLSVAVFSIILRRFDAIVSVCFLCVSSLFLLWIFIFEPMQLNTPWHQVQFTYYRHTQSTYHFNWFTCIIFDIIQPTEWNVHICSVYHKCVYTFLTYNFSLRAKTIYQ